MTRNTEASDTESYHTEVEDETVTVIRERSVAVLTLDGKEGEKTEREVVATFPADWDAVSEIMGKLTDELAPAPPWDGKSVTQQMDEAYDR
jgi:hypothetical protein